MWAAINIRWPRTPGMTLNPGALPRTAEQPGSSPRPAPESAIGDGLQQRTADNVGKGRVPRVPVAAVTEDSDLVEDRIQRAHRS